MSTSSEPPKGRTDVNGPKTAKIAVRLKDFGKPIQAMRLPRSKIFRWISKSGAIVYMGVRPEDVELMPAEGSVARPQG